MFKVVLRVGRALCSGTPGRGGRGGLGSPVTRAPYCALCSLRDLRTASGGLTAPLCSARRGGTWLVTGPGCLWKEPCPERGPGLVHWPAPAPREQGPRTETPSVQRAAPWTLQASPGPGPAPSAAREREEAFPAVSPSAAAKISVPNSSVSPPPVSRVGRLSGTGGPGWFGGLATGHGVGVPAALAALGLLWPRLPAEEDSRKCSLRNGEQGAQLQASPAPQH